MKGFVVFSGFEWKKQFQKAVKLRIYTLTDKIEACRMKAID